MSEEWVAVARAIDQRLEELGLRQRELAERSQVSQATVRELQHDTVRRRRSARTLEALSQALDWHSDHLSALLDGRQPPQADQTASTDEVPMRLAAIERHLRRITRQLDHLNSRLDEVSGRDGEATG